MKRNTSTPSQKEMERLRMLAQNSRTVPGTTTTIITPFLPLSLPHSLYVYLSLMYVASLLSRATTWTNIKEQREEQLNNNNNNDTQSPHPTNTSIDDSHSNNASPSPLSPSSRVLKPLNTEELMSELFNMIPDTNHNNNNNSSSSSPTSATVLTHIPTMIPRPSSALGRTQTSTSDLSIYLSIYLSFFLSICLFIWF